MKKTSFKKAAKLIASGYIVYNDKENIELLRILFKKVCPLDNSIISGDSHYYYKDGNVWLSVYSYKNPTNIIRLSSIKPPKTEYQKKYLSKKTFKKEVKEIVKSNLNDSEIVAKIRELCNDTRQKK